MRKILDTVIWYYDHGTYKVYTNAYSQKKQLEDLRRVKPCNYYSIPGEGRAWDFLVPIGDLRKVKRILEKKNYGGISPKSRNALEGITGAKGLSMRSF